ncbi:MAG: phosphotransferase [Thermoleophilia bacterium]|nr:phosphotransferase [Thermoleophilia bacterium]
MSRAVVEELFPQLQPRHVRAIEDGWDSLVLDLDGDWIVRIPRRAQVRETLVTEIRLLPELGPTLPVPTPRFEQICGDDRAVAYRKVLGDPVDVSRTVLGEQLGRVLAALHAFPVERARALGVPSHDRTWRERYEAFVTEVLARAGPLLGGDRPRAEATVAEYFGDDANFGFTPRLLHADIGPEHVLSAGDRLTGVIDWGDARIGDPALDLAWALHGTPVPFGEAVLAAYASDDSLLVDRARFFHRLGPWYELHYGLFFDRPEFVQSGLAGVRSRLPPALR